MTSYRKPTLPLRRSPNRRGFTLLEMMIVVGIIALILSVAMNGMMGAFEDARAVKAQADIQSMTTNIQRYMMKGGGAYPKDLNALVPNIMESIPKDPWGNDYKYLRPGKHNPTRYDIWSTGPSPDNANDDIGNWTQKQL
jgi:general secretion pathway protein G